MELTTKQIMENRKERLKSCRKEHNLLMIDVGKYLGVGKSSVSRWESGETGGIKLDQLKKLASLYNVDAAWLYGYDVPKEPESQEHKDIKNRIFALIENASDEDLKKIEQVINLFLAKIGESKDESK